MAKSLLAHLYSRIKGSQEDVATYSLQYLISQSEVLNDTYTRLMEKALDCKIEPVLNYECQKVGSREEKERPDMTGTDQDGKLFILNEMKFYAALTANQPNTYLKRIKEAQGVGLVFICPTSRKTELWSELLNSVSEYNKTKVEECVEVDGVRLAIMTWTEIMDRLLIIAKSQAPESVSDIEQLKGYCQQIDEEEFFPFDENDLSAGQAIKNDRYYAVLEEVKQLLIADKRYNFSKNRLQSKGYRGGFSCRLRYKDYILSIYYDIDMWKDNNSIETPFWLQIRDSKDVQTDNIKRLLSSIDKKNRTLSSWNTICLALIATPHASKISVCEKIKEQILDYLDELKML